MDSNDLEQGQFFTTDGTDIWEKVFYCMQPSCQLRNLKTGDTEDFGMGGLTAQKFHRIKMPIGEAGKDE